MPVVFEYHDIIPTPLDHPMVTMGMGCAICGSVDGKPEVIELKIAQIASTYQLVGGEIQRLCNILKTWPKDIWDQGVNEELENLLAARELSRLKPLTIEYFEELKEVIASRGDVR
jgi:hypothetical protein